MRTIIFGAFPALIIAAQPAVASNWIEVSSSDNQVTELDVESVRLIAGQERQAWLKTTLTKSDAEGVKEMRTLERFRCNDETGAFMSMIEYAADGRVLNSLAWETYERRYRPRAPDTTGYAELKIVCQLGI